MENRNLAFAELMQSVQNGSEEAACELLRLYGPVIVREVRKHLHPRLRSKFDSVDFVQAVWLSFFSDTNEARHFEHPNQLIGFLAAIARHKVGGEFRRRMQTTKHNVCKEQRLNDSEAPVAELILSPGPTPSQTAMAHEWWQRLLRGQPEHYQEIMRLRYQGLTFLEIADRLDIDERTVRRAFKKVLQDSIR